MPQCVKIRKKKRQACVGDMRDRIIIQDRDIVPPVGDSVDLTELFSGDQPVWAGINTVSGETIFDGTGTERDVTHRLITRYIEGVTSENWILTEGDERLDILDVENLDERSEYMLLRCTNRGTSSNAASSV